MTQAKLSRWFGVAVAALVAVGVSARAEEPKVQAPQPFVVVVGIGDYADKQIKKRPRAEADAKALYGVLTDAKYLGVDEKHARLLVGKDATHKNILDALQWATAEAKANDPVLFAFFGGGGPVGDTGDRRCYFASDSTFKGRDKDAVSASEIADILKNLKSEKFCAFVDVDFKGFDPGDKAIAEPSLGTPPYVEFLGDDGSEDHNALAGRVLFLATNGLSVSPDLKDNGLFATALVEALKGKADKDGYEPDSQVTVDEVATYLGKRLRELARENDLIKDGKPLPEHFVLGGRSHNYSLTHNPDAVGATKGRLEKFALLAKDGKVDAKQATEGRNLLERMPKLKAQQELRKEYQALADGKLTAEEFEKRRDDILEKMKLRRSEAMDFARSVMEAVDVIHVAHVKETKKGEMVNWAVRGLYRRADEKVPDTIAERLKKVSDLKDFDLTELLADSRQQLGKREDLADHKDVDITLQRMLHHLDPYTTYIDAETLENFKKDVQGNFTGIGIQIRKDAGSDQLLVVTPIKGSPAYKAGLQAGDIVTLIKRKVDSDGKPLDKEEEIPTKGLPLSDAVKKILGKAGSKVAVVVQREGVDKPLTFEITRGRVEVETVLGAKRKDNDDWDFFIDADNKIGYARLTSFSQKTASQLAEAMADLTRKGVKGFVLDLRFNPGGLLNSAVEISDLYMDDGLIVKIKPRPGIDREKRYTGVSDGSLLDFPMVCLVNGQSASGSEIVSAALQDHKRALIVGERSYGKGSVQTIQPFQGGEIKLTTASFWRPNGLNLNKSSTSGKDEDVWGVTPDRLIKLTPKERDDLAEAQRDAEIIQPAEKRGKDKKEFKDKQLEAALEYLRGQIKTASKVPTRKAG